jgi:hypothetical protein
MNKRAPPYRETLMQSINRVSFISMGNFWEREIRFYTEIYQEKGAIKVETPKAVPPAARAEQLLGFQLFPHPHTQDREQINLEFFLREARRRRASLKKNSVLFNSRSLVDKRLYTFTNCLEVWSMRAVLPFRGFTPEPSSNPATVVVPGGLSLAGLK